MTEEMRIVPVQPYLLLNADGYRQVSAGSLGISHFYEFMIKSGQLREFQAVPDGTTDLVFGIGPYDVHIYIGGTVLRIKQWEFEEGRMYFGVRFLPGKCILPESLTIQEVVNADLELDRYIFGSGLPEQLALGKDINERARIFINWYVGWKQRKETEDSVHTLERYVRNRIYASSGTITIKELAADTGYSECYIRRSFEQVHGISPKVFERFVRFQTLLHSIHRKADTAAMEELAVDCGYYDQSHMMKDFKSFCGTTPENYRRLILGKQNIMLQIQNKKGERPF